MQKRKQILGNPRFQTVPSGWSPATGLGTSLEDVKCNASMPSRGSVARESDCDTHSNVLRQRSSPVLVTVLYLLLNAQSVAARLEVAVSRRYQAHGGSAAFLNTLPSGRVSEPGWTNGQTRVRQRTMRPFLKDSRRIAWSRSMRRHDASRHQGHAFGSRSRSSSLRSISDDCGENGDGGSNDHLPAEVEVHLPADVELDLPTEVEVKVEVEDTSPPVQEEEIVAVAAGASAALEVAGTFDSRFELIYSKGCRDHTSFVRSCSFFCWRCLMGSRTRVSFDAGAPGRRSAFHVHPVILTGLILYNSVCRTCEGLFIRFRRRRGILMRSNINIRLCVRQSVQAIILQASKCSLRNDSAVVDLQRPYGTKSNTRYV